MGAWETLAREGRLLGQGQTGLGLEQVPRWQHSGLQLEVPWCRRSRLVPPGASYAALSPGAEYMAFPSTSLPLFRGASWAFCL